jgi:hypothetical protein
MLEIMGEHVSSRLEIFSRKLSSYIMITLVSFHMIYRALTPKKLELLLKI